VARSVCWRLGAVRLPAHERREGMVQPFHPGSARG
jgi:hypothetical protein